MGDPRIRRAQSCAADARRAAQEFHAGVTQPDMELVVFFCSSEYDLDALAAEMRRLFVGAQVVGCTTAGEIGPEGCRSHSLSGASFPARGFTAVSALLDNLGGFDHARGRAFAQSLMRKLEQRVPQTAPENCFAILLIDGLCGCEESVAHALQQTLGKTVLCGGSAADERKFVKTFVYSDGQFRSDSAVAFLVRTRLPFRAFMSHHFVATDERLVVTEADTTRRVVSEINGRPAAEEYARLLGVDADSLGSAHFAAAPVLVKVAGTDHVRSIQSANPDRSLNFFCAIDRGLVLRVGQGLDLSNNLEQVFDRIDADMGTPQLALTFDCALRAQEVSRNRANDRVDAVFRNNNAVGFNTYGEQFHGAHVNQTLTGIAIGYAAQPPGEPGHA
ncbi:MAG: FIST N-terminal domain-containing protein [Burkholderiaceae bacterium]|nr:FIST N-terminal domain-containing protein [Burkholderiaceae bacterium]